MNRQGSIGIDTAIVLFLLAVEYGRAVALMSAEGLLMGVTMSMVLVLPYMLPAGAGTTAPATWLTARQPPGRRDRTWLAAKRRNASGLAIGSLPMTS